MSSQSASGRVGSGPRTAAIDYFSSPIHALRAKTFAGNAQARFAVRLCYS